MIIKNNFGGIYYINKTQFKIESARDQTRVHLRSTIANQYLELPSKHIVSFMKH